MLYLHLQLLKIADCPGMMETVDQYVSTTLASAVGRLQLQPASTVPILTTIPQSTAAMLQAVDVADRFGKKVLEVAANMELHDVSLFCVLCCDGGSCRHPHFCGWI